LRTDSVPGDFDLVPATRFLRGNQSYETPIVRISILKSVAPDARVNDAARTDDAVPVSVRGRIEFLRKR
jgi:hypothetical protein